MELQEMEGYQEAIEQAQQVLSAMPLEQRLAGLTLEQRLAGLTPERRLDLLRVLLATLPEATCAEFAKQLATEK
jgi:hypothetical protein